ncbi:MAG: peptide ABC transporter substrate-binding protein [Spirochaetes bacterium]|nr:peptide ABC transporter substrate-binding protein [Spirochaetota bacterium]
MKIQITIAAAVLSLCLFPLAAESAPPESFVTLYNESKLEFDPQLAIYSTEAQIFTALYEGLFTYDPASLEALPALAESWTKSKDGLVYTFVIRKGALWSDGSPIKAVDFRDTWLRLLKNNAQYAAFFDLIDGAADYRLGKTTDPASVGIDLSGEGRLVVKLLHPAEYFTRLLCHHAFSVIHPSMRIVSDWASKIPFPVSGPYEFVSYDGQSLKLRKNPTYWDSGSVSIPELEMRFTDDDAEASGLFNNEEAHWLAGPGDYNAILLDKAIQTNPIFSTYYWYFDCSAAPWSDGRVRRALALLLPWSELRDPSKYLVPTSTLVLSMSGYNSAKGIELQNKEEAMRLLGDAGYPGGAALPELKIRYADGTSGKRVSTIFKTAWESQLSIKVTLMPISPSIYYETLAKTRDIESGGLAHSTWIGDFADPEAFLQMWTTDSPLNDARYNDKEFQRLMDESSTKEGKERLRILADAETVLLQSAAVLPLCHGYAYSIIDIDYIEGWYQNALDLHPYKYLKFGTPSIGPNMANLGKGTKASL